MYKDGEIVPNPNKLLNCYRCKCKGSSIICGLIDCQFRFDCQSRYRLGECCPNYDHCDTPSTSTEQSVFENQTTTYPTSITPSALTTSSSPKPTTLKANSTALLTDLISPEEMNTTHKQTDGNSIVAESSSNSLNDQEQSTTTLDTISSILLSTSDEQSYSSTVSPIRTVSSTLTSASNRETTLDSNELNFDNQPIERDDRPISESAGALNTHTNSELNRVSASPNKVIESNSLDKADVKLFNQSVTSSSSNDDDELSSNIGFQTKFTQSPSNDITPLNSNQVDQIDKRIDDLKVYEDKNKNEILDESSFQPTTLADFIKSNSQQLTTVDSLSDTSVPSSTTIPNITDTTILAPNTSSIVNFTTQSPVLKDDELGKQDLNKKNEDFDEFAKNDSSFDKGKSNNKILSIEFNKLVNRFLTFTIFLI